MLAARRPSTPMFSGAQLIRLSFASFPSLSSDDPRYHNIEGSQLPSYVVFIRERPSCCLGILSQTFGRSRYLIKCPITACQPWPSSSLGTSYPSVCLLSQAQPSLLFRLSVSLANQAL